MIHMVVADDMPMQLHTLEELVRMLRPAWQLHTARDGNEVLALLEEYSVDFVLSDIRMPKMDGLLMLERIQTRFPKTLVVFLSGYALFEYAQRALRLGAVDFLVKPLDEESLAALLEKLESLARAQAGEQRVAEASLLNQWLYTPLAQIPQQESERIAALVGERGVLAAVFRPSMPGRYDLSFQNRMREHFAGEYTVQCLLPHADRELLLLVLEPKGAATEDLFGLRERMASLCRHSGMRVGLAAFSERRGFEARACALYALNEAFYTDQLTEAAHVPLERGSGSLPSGAELFGALRAEREEREQWAARRLREAWGQRQWFPRVLQDAVYTMAEVVEQMEQGNAGEAEEELLRDFAGRIRQVLGWQAFCAVYQEAMEALAERIENSAGQTDLPIERCIRYLQTHFAEEISMEELSRMCFLTPNYFSSLFRKKTGKRFVEYLTDLRLSKAESRIRQSGDFIYEIAKECGYRDERYFNRVFRGKYGCSPARYRKLHGKVHP